MTFVFMAFLLLTHPNRWALCRLENTAKDASCYLSRCSAGLGKSPPSRRCWEASGVLRNLLWQVAEVVVPNPPRYAAATGGADDRRSLRGVGCRVGRHL